jgi:MFS superfamily sulfate permease-like transporter
MIEEWLNIIAMMIATIVLLLMVAVCVGLVYAVFMAIFDDWKKREK